MHIENHIQQSKHILNQVAFELGDSNNLDRAFRILRSVLHVLRDRLPIEESFDFMAQLPLFIKAVYVDGWNPKKQRSRVKSALNFVSAVREYHGKASLADFPNRISAILATRAVLRVLQRDISAGEVKDITAVLPRDLKEFWSHA